MTTEANQLRAVIDEFLQARLQPKLDKLKEGDEEKRQKLLEEHQPINWIGDAARRVGQIQQITHALKYIHPEAKGTNLSSPGNTDAGAFLIGTHTIAKQYAPDVVGNAAALDVYKFLRLEVNGKTILNRALEKDALLQEAFSSDSSQASVWIDAFAALTESKGAPTSHKLAKQLYWPMEEGRYHLLAPLFPTSLVHEVWSTVREDRFSEEAKSARESRRKDEPHSHGYCEYPNMVIQKFGGTKPQNISQLNSERYGEDYLLRSTPPEWISNPVRLPLNAESVFDSWFSNRARVRELVHTLREFLYRVKDTKSNVRIRNKRQELVGYIVDEMLHFAATLREQEEPWTQRPECKLNIDEQCWFNPVRVEYDEVFASEYRKGSWKEEVCKRFANWLNAQLLKKKKPLPFGDKEHDEWTADLSAELRMLRLEVSEYE